MMEENMTMIIKAKTRLNRLISLMLLASIFLSGCTATGDQLTTTAPETTSIFLEEATTTNPMLAGSNGDLVFRNEYVDFNTEYKVPYVNYDEVFLKEDEENPTSGRYANLTADGKINWDVTETERLLEETPIAKEMVLQLTIDGEKKPLPLKFADLGEAYAVFDQIDFSKLTNDMYPFTITDIKSGTKLYALSDYGEKTRLINVVNEDNILVMKVVVELNRNYIIGVANGGMSEIAIKDIRVDGIGTGNTLNEIYEKFGTPIKYESRHTVMPNIQYFYETDQKVYSILLFYEEEFSKGHGRVQRIKNNVITSVDVYSREVK